MILKIETGNGSWVYIESNRFYVNKSKLKNYHNNSAEFIFSDDIHLQVEPVMAIIDYSASTKDYKTIVTNRHCFLLNDIGKTVDRIM